MQLKESDYNFIYDDLGKDQIVFYNSRTGALANDCAHHGLQLSLHILF